jgi:protein CpxP
MKTWLKRTLYGVFGASILAGGLSACSYGMEGRHGMRMDSQHSAERHGKMLERVSSRLELNAEQKKRLVTLSEKLHEQRLALVGKTTDPRAEFQALVAGDKFDKARAQSLITEKAAALNSKSPEVLAAAADFYDNLTPAQQQKVREFMQGRRGWRHHG